MYSTQLYGNDESNQFVSDLIYLPLFIDNVISYDFGDHQFNLRNKSVLSECMDFALEMSTDG